MSDEGDNFCAGKSDGQHEAGCCQTIESSGGGGPGGNLGGGGDSTPSYLYCTDTEE